jgi:hypothetical protein
MAACAHRRALQRAARPPCGSIAQRPARRWAPRVLPRPGRALAADSSSGRGSGSSGGSDNSTSAGGGSNTKQQVPWNLTAYYTKKLERRTDALGNMVPDPALIAEPANWSPDVQLALAIRVRAATGRPRDWGVAGVLHAGVEPGCMQ